MIDSIPLKYLEKSKIEEIAAKLEGEGYLVSKSTNGADADFDLIARKQGKTIAYEVKASPLLSQSIASIRELRQRSWKSGYDEFRLVVVNPPHERQVDIDGLDRTFRGYLEENPPEEIIGLSSAVTVEDVWQIDIDRVEVKKDRIHVVGSGVIVVTLIWGGGREGVDLKTDFPFRFDVHLASDLEIEEVCEITVDVSSFDDIDPDPSEQGS